jgi:transcriptional regulator with XRE-family HTH domain
MSEFGKHIKRLRNARGLTQEQLADRANLAPDTIRRLEHEEFSPSLRTITRVVKALGLRLSTVFLSYELGDEDPSAREVLDLLAGRSAAEIAFVLKFVRMILAELDAYRRAG